MAATMTEKIKFAGVTFSAKDRGDDNYTVRSDVFRKIMLGGNAIATLNYHHDDMGPVGDQDAVPTAEQVLSSLDGQTPGVLYYTRKRHEIRFAPHRNLSYTIREKPKAIAKKLYCLTHRHGEGTDCYLFKATDRVDAGEVAAQLGVDFDLLHDETLTVDIVKNIKISSVDCPTIIE